ncbi:ATP phosphoribosyltransferase regulatory subunit [Primorskyibacter sp. S187A]|uniref:ATP phosphoribosyltransferase regulatory subunit n=1 Tax=Primorskyibacter sp. S187A TaxID=3415130 RepID=UPI003C79F518
MTERARIMTEAAALRASFEARGAQPIETPILQPADTLLDLYGEDIRARAYVTSDPLRGEQMLRPDFTVPVVQMHMAHGAEPARYAYAGEVFRKQEDDPHRENEYFQAGFEVFDRQDPVRREAEVFAALAEPLHDVSLRAVTGDIGILKAAVQGMETTSRRKAALLRHIWRPRRFRALLERFAGRMQPPLSRQTMLAAADPFANAAPHIGLRSRSEIEDRIAALHEDAQAAPIAARDVDLIDAILSVRDTLPAALERLSRIARDMPAIEPAVARLQERIDAMDQIGQKPDEISFEGSYGRSTMEYYDGFVFGLFATARPEWPPLGSGGRYDALTAVLGEGRNIPAVGGVLRPGLLLQLREGAQ